MRHLHWRADLQRCTDGVSPGPKVEDQDCIQGVSLPIRGASERAPAKNVLYASAELRVACPCRNTNHAPRSIRLHVDFDAGKLTIERQLEERDADDGSPQFGPTKTKESRVVMLGAEAVSRLRAFTSLR